jgi:hypothetical protein
MSFLSKVTKGKVKRPKIVLIFASDGIGKTTWASQAPNPIFLGVEDGSSHLDVARFPQPQTWKDVLGSINALKTEKHDYKTLVIDSLDWLEPVLHREICNEYGVNSIEKAAGGYGKGYGEAVNKWADLTRELSALRDIGMNVILIAHAEVVKFSDPMMQTEYDRYQLKLYKKSAALMREFCDAVLFATYEMFTKKDGSRTRAFGEGVRVVYTERRPGFDAKNRFGLPYQIPLDWNEFEKACDNGQPHSPTYLREQIMELTKEITDADLKKKIEETVEKAGSDAAKLEQIKNRILVKLEQPT